MGVARVASGAIILYSVAATRCVKLTSRIRLTRLCGQIRLGATVEPQSRLPAQCHNLWAHENRGLHLSRQTEGIRLSNSSSHALQLKYCLGL
jgi:hypothetical protein